MSFDIFQHTPFSPKVLSGFITQVAQVECQLNGQAVDIEGASTAAKLYKAAV
jgi:hypothetical protein